MNNRTLDALIAEHVFGESIMFTEISHPDYSSDISAAWEVVEKMGKGVQCYPSKSRPGQWCCRLDNELNLLEFAPTAPMAICKAALAALGVKYDNNV